LKPRVSILCHTLAGNALGRAWVFHELLRDDFELELVVSARRNDAIWKPLAQSGLTPRRWFVRTWPGFRWRARQIARELVTGELVIAIKPRLHSYGLALTARRERLRPVLLDVDDWELGFFSPWSDAASAPFSWMSAASNLHTRWYFRRTGLADAITVSTTYLARRLGGTCIPHARPESLPAGRALSPHPLVMFAGTPRPHKGLPDLVQAFRSVRLPDARLCIIGADHDRELALAAQSDRRIHIEPSVPLEALPGRLARAWVIAIPQRDELVSRAQLPAKLIDAMALGKAIVSTDVGDMRRWLSDDCGRVVPPGDPARLGAAIEALLVDAEQTARIGANARARFLALASERAVRPRLLAIVEALLAGRSVPAATSGDAMSGFYAAERPLVGT
jgi:glycosyltransferase involved in cell wall biosynthesis